MISKRLKSLKTLTFMDIQYLLFLQNIRESVGDVFNSFCIFITTIAVDYYILVPAFVGGLLVVFWWTTVAGPIGKMIDTNWGYFLTQASTPVVFMVVYPALCFGKTR